MAGRLYVSFWHLSIDDLPQGLFEHREIGVRDAGAIIRAARAGKTLLCVSDDDLLAPYRTTKRRRHEELCALLRASYDCPLHFEDFLTAFDDEERPVYSIMPLQVAELQRADRLLVVTCNWAAISSPDRRASRNPFVRLCCSAKNQYQAPFFQIILARRNATLQLYKRALDGREFSARFRRFSRCLSVGAPKKERRGVSSSI